MSAGGGGVGWIAQARYSLENPAWSGPDRVFRIHLGRALDALDAVLALHRPMEGGKGLVYCCVCVDDSYDEIPWPCPTVRAIEGDRDGSP